MDSEPILKKTLLTMAAMVGACVTFVGTLSLAAVLVTSHAVNPNGSDSASSSSSSDKSEPNIAAPLKPGAPVAMPKGAPQRI